MEAKPISENKPDLYAVASLRLDNFNPRLPAEAEEYSQTALLMYLEEHFDLLPIARSLSDNGYFDEEPLIVIPSDEGQNAFIVIEGNRRLAALKFLTDPEVRAKSSFKEQYDALAESAVENLLSIPAVKYEKRSQTIRMLGFRHIAGIRKWSSFSKARFLYNFVEDNTKIPLMEMGRMLGERTETIKKHYVAYCIFKQAKENDFDTSKMIEEFSIFYTALGRVAFQSFLGFEYNTLEVGGCKKPVPDSHLKQLEELITWIHGTEDAEAIISDSRELKYLSAVVVSTRALEYIRAGGKLLDAYSLTADESQAVLNSINQASFHIEESLRFLHRHRQDSNVHDALFRCAQSLQQALNYYPDIKTELFTEEPRA